MVVNVNNYKYNKTGEFMLMNGKGNDRLSYLIEDPQGFNYIYQSTKYSGIMPRFNVLLTMEIKPNVLKTALKDILKIYPQYAIGYKEENGEYHYIHLDTEPPVFYDKGNPVHRIATKETGGYFFCVSYEGCSLRMDFYHGLGDGLSYIEVLNSLLYRYFQLLGLPLGNDKSIKTMDMPYEEEEGSNPYDLIEETANPYEGEQEYKSAFSITSDPKKLDKADTVVQIRLPFSVLRGVAKQYKSSPVTFISPLFSHAIYENYRSEIKESSPIISAIPVNLRTYYKTKSTRYFVALAKLAYGEEFLKTSDPEEIFSIQKKILDVQTNKDYLSYQAYKNECNAKRFKESKISLDEKKKLGRNSSVDALKEYTYIITNMGGIKLPEVMEQYVHEYYPVLPTGILPFTIALTSYKGEMILSVTQQSENIKVCERFVELMNDAEIPAYISKTYKFHTMSFEL